MLIPSIGLFAVAALFGLYMASRLFKGVLAPWPASIFHGLFAASGLVVLLYGVITGTMAAPVLIAAGLLVVAALGGFVLGSFHLRKVAGPKALVVVHASAAVIGVATLLAAALGLV